MRHHRASRRQPYSRRSDAKDPPKPPAGFANSVYDCQRRTPLHGPNDELVELLGVIEHHRYLRGLEPMALVYRRALSALKAYPEKIESAEEAARIPGIGPKISALVGEYLERGQIEEIKQIGADDEVAALDALTKIYGVGPKGAAALIAQGFRTIPQLRQGLEQDQVKLTKAQILGLKHYEDLNQKYDCAACIVPRLAFVRPGVGFRGARWRGWQGTFGNFSLPSTSREGCHAADSTLWEGIGGGRGCRGMWIF